MSFHVTHTSPHSLCFLLESRASSLHLCLQNQCPCTATRSGTGFKRFRAFQWKPKQNKLKLNCWMTPAGSSRGPALSSLSETAKKTPKIPAARRRTPRVETPPGADSASAARARGVPSPSRGSPASPLTLGDPLGLPVSRPQVAPHVGRRPPLLLPGHGAVGSGPPRSRRRHRRQGPGRQQGPSRRCHAPIRAVLCPAEPCRRLKSLPRAPPRGPADRQRAPLGGRPLTPPARSSASGCGRTGGMWGGKAGRAA